MSSVARGNPTGVLALLLFAGLLLGTGCLGTQGAGSFTTPNPPPTGPATVAVQTMPSLVFTTGTPDLAAPPPKASPFPTSSVDPIVGTWYAPPPDDLTFEFFPDGTFTEQSTNFQTFHGTWGISEEKEAGFYDATVLDRWGYRKQVHILITSGNLYIKSMGTLHRIG